MKNLILVCTLMILTSSCKKDELYTIEECSKMKKGDTIYTYILCSYEKCIVLKNTPEKRIIEVLNVKYYWDSNILSYDDFRFKYK